MLQLRPTQHILLARTQTNLWELKGFKLQAGVRRVKKTFSSTSSSWSAHLQLALFALIFFDKKQIRKMMTSFVKSNLVTVYYLFCLSLNIPTVGTTVQLPQGHAHRSRRSGPAWCGRHHRAGKGPILFEKSQGKKTSKTQKGTVVFLHSFGGDTLLDIFWMVFLELSPLVSIKGPSSDQKLAKYSAKMSPQSRGLDKCVIWIRAVG